MGIVFLKRDTIDDFQSFLAENRKVITNVSPKCNLSNAVANRKFAYVFSSLASAEFGFNGGGNGLCEERQFATNCQFCQTCQYSTRIAGEGALSAC